ncbi:formylmethanofuran dehydrogenase subunit E [Desulfitobacterium dehalogenans ATCC 51507]|uniref:Formylmethanofuran dehydrogenase subunit E n=1 Tax=Desulfitobacterium dehalogenans (strain ATCC 51507 / DSM 9161 / JW/IU-DC1) TaxID=756499 RepID=I4AA07_DESDJ|nr:formylmethanofuran dehydrogenase subunit E family protein [Desulfitobacterium dehalogenans]AFM00792.1 formylmethanofuran dehydrogenase subunit E [Desulfitobacterium dehalogenans ATCC 51507]
MCVEKTPWELVIDFHGHTCPDIALGYRVAQLAQREMGIRPAPDSECLVKAYTQSCALDAVQVLNKATIGRRALIIEETQHHIYQFHFTGTQEIHQFTVSSDVLDHLKALQHPDLSPRERQNKVLEGVQYVLTLEESAFCQYDKIPGELRKL